MTTTKPETPELDKQSQIIDSGDTAVVQDFLDWLTSRGYVIAEWAETHQTLTEPVETLQPLYSGPEQLMADYFEIDLDKIDAERRSLLDYLRSIA